MDVSLVIRRRLKDLGLEQRGLAAAAQVTESYVSQLLARKKAPPAPRRTDIYEKMEVFLRLQRGELARLAEVQRKEELKKKLGDPPVPLFKEFRALLLAKCVPENRLRVRTIMEREPFGELEKLVAQKLLDVARGVARTECNSDKWVRLAARLGKRSVPQIKVILDKLLALDVFSVTVDECIPLLNPLIDSWNIDLETFGMDVVLNSRMAPGRLKRFEFIERSIEHPATEPGLEEFLKDKTLSGDIAEEEIAFLKMLNLRGRRPYPIYYYRELQNLRDPVHFRDLA